jgi:hypothetical protein
MSGATTTTFGTVQVHRQRAIGAGHGDQVRHQLGGDRRARLVLAILARVAEVRHHGSDPPRRRPLGGIEHDQQLHQVVGRRVRGLDDEHVAAADVLVEAHRDLTVLEARHDHVTDRHLEPGADGLRQLLARGTGEDATRIQTGPPLTYDPMR